MRSLALSVFLLLICAAPLSAALDFPALTGRVVDQAHVLSPSTVSSLDQALANYEQGTSNQVVVVTLASLQGTSIEDYGYQLGRHWGIGQKGTNNGVLLIVAPHERKVRIEVGYGLEGVLTDAASSEIVQGIILPQFRAGHMEQGIIDGTQAIVSVLGGKGMPAHQQVSPQSLGLSAFLIFALIVLPFWLFIHFGVMLLPVGVPTRLGSSRIGSSFSSGGWGSGGGFSGFSGGGGSFGGGGASGGW